ncbi:hypothetical protein JCM10212_004010 [Sporobolomyces blumeae]
MTPSTKRILTKGAACTMCKRRKVRCDAIKPACTACQRSARFKGEDPALVCCDYSAPRRRRTTGSVRGLDWSPDDRSIALNGTSPAEDDVHDTASSSSSSPHAGSSRDRDRQVIADASRSKSRGVQSCVSPTSPAVADVKPSPATSVAGPSLVGDGLDTFPIAFSLPSTLYPSRFDPQIYAYAASSFFDGVPASVPPDKLELATPPSGLHLPRSTSYSDPEAFVRSTFPILSSPSSLSPASFSSFDSDLLDQSPFALADELAYYPSASPPLSSSTGSTSPVLSASSSTTSSEDYLSSCFLPTAHDFETLTLLSQPSLW